MSGRRPELRVEKHFRKMKRQKKAAKTLAVVPTKEPV